MRIDRLLVKNFKGFAELELELSPHFNLLIGDNGTGKTSILEALLVATGGWFMGLRFAAIKAAGLSLRSKGPLSEAGATKLESEISQRRGDGSFAEFCVAIEQAVPAYLQKLRARRARTGAIRRQERR